MNPSFGPTSLKGLEPTMNRYYRDFLDGLEEQAAQNDGIVEMNQWFHNLSFDVPPPSPQVEYSNDARLQVRWHWELISIV